MRELKFEYGFLSNSGIVKKVYSLSEIPNIKEKCDVWNELPIIYVREFTGLKDKNGVDIYEGDVLEYKNELGRHHVAKIFYKKGGLCFNVHKDDFYKKPKEIHFYESCADMQSKGFIVQFKIIGNIHENKDLV
jgi:uncharacterized phage protein (TIGR01671 family)